MVTTRIVSRYTGEIPRNGRAGRKIPGGPLYPADDVLGVLRNSGIDSIQTWTRKCTEDVQYWGLDADDLYELLEIAVQRGRYRDSEWCIQQPGGPWAACDSYSIVRREQIPNIQKEMDIEYFLKFAISKNGNLLLIASCHPPENRR